MKKTGPTSWPDRFCDCGDPISKFARSGKPRSRKQYMNAITCNGPCFGKLYSRRNKKLADKKRVKSLKSWVSMEAFDLFALLPVIRPGATE